MLIIPLLLTIASPPSLPLQDAEEGIRFGRSVLALGDLDGDGVQELAVGAPAATAAGRQDGVVFVLSGATRAVLQTWTGEPGRSAFGFTLRSAGDTNADGTDDVLVGYENTCRTAVRSGTDGAPLTAFDRAWYEVHALGDLDEDGADDVLLVGRHLEVRSGRDASLLAGPLYTGRSAAQRYSFHPVGDLDADGLTDGVLVTEKPALLLSARKKPSGDAGQANAVWGGLYDFPARRPVAELIGRAGARVLGAGPAGDLDGDGRQDFVLTVTGQECSEIHALSLEHDEALFVRELRLESGAWVVRDDERLPALIPAGDLDEDGHGDLLCALPVSPFKVGIRAVSGADGGSLWETTWADGGATAGCSLARCADHDGDGVPDLFIGSSDWVWHGTVFATGEVRLHSGASSKLLWRTPQADVRRAR